MGRWGGAKLYRHEQRQNREIERLSQLQGQIEQLQNDNEILKEQVSQTVEYYRYETNYQADSYNYFAIGNSLTLIKGNWGRGICATQPDNDYFGLLKTEMGKRRGRDVVAYRYNFATWERSANRAACLKLIDPYLNSMLNLVTIQLGENVKNVAKFEEDLVSLIEYVREKAPKAQVVVVGDFWDKNRNELRKQAAMQTGCKFVDLEAIIGDKAYQSEAGLSVKSLDGLPKKVLPVEETHPGDKGMEYIFHRVLEEVE